MAAQPHKMLSCRCFYIFFIKFNFVFNRICYIFIAQINNIGKLHLEHGRDIFMKERWVLVRNWQIALLPATTAAMAES